MTSKRRTVSYSVKGRKRGRRAPASRGSAEQGLFGIKKGQFGRTRSAHGRKSKTTFHKLVFDAKTMRARVARKWKALL